MSEHVRIEKPNLAKTEKLLEQILIPIIKQRARVRFLCPAGEGAAIAQRIRVMLSRKRRAMEQRSQKVRRFRLHSSIHHETHEGVRYDCLIMWQSVSEAHIMTQELEDLMTERKDVA